jgi:single-stranded DNA-binding protein
VAVVGKVLKNGRQLYIKGEIIHKKYKNTEYTKWKTKIQNKKINMKIIFKNVSSN